MARVTDWPAPPSSIRMSSARWVRLEQACVVVVFAWLAWRTIRVFQAGWLFTQDDAYITLRYARHLAEGHGLAWNVGEKISVEGYSNFLFVLLGAGALKVGLDPIVFLKVSCCAAVAPSCGLLYVLARRWLRPLAATLPAVLLTSHPGLAFWAVSGLETMVFQLWVVAATTAFVLGLDATTDRSAESVGAPFAPWRSRYRLHLLAAAFCFLAAITRPEGPLVCVVFAATALLDTAVRWLRARARGDWALRDATRNALWLTLRAFVLAFLLPYATYFAWRFGHFGRLVPNSVYCKADYNDRGGDPWTLIRDLWKDGKVFILLALVQDPRKLGARALPLFLLPLAYTVILFDADPIAGQFSRHYLAALALLVVASSTGIANVVELVVAPFRLVGRAVSGGGLASSREGGAPSQALPWRSVVDAVVVVACLALHARGQAWRSNETPRVCANRFDDQDDPWRLAPPFDLAYHASCYSSRMEGRAKLGRYLDEVLSPEQAYVLGDVGIAPYLSHANVIDAFCLNSAELTRPPISFDQGRFIDSIFDTSPDVIVVHSWSPAPGINPVANEVGRPSPARDFYPPLVADPRFRARYQPKRGAPPFHAPLEGEGYYYAVYEKKDCSLAVETDNAVCDACLQRACCSEANACAAEPSCAACMSSADGPAERCGGTRFRALDACVGRGCSTECVGQ